MEPKRARQNGSEAANCFPLSRSPFKVGLGQYPSTYWGDGYSQELFQRSWETVVWRMIRTKSANDKIAKCTCGNAYSTPLHNLYGTHENSIPFLHRDLTAAHFTSLSLLNREPCQMFGCLSLKGHITVGVLTNVHLVGGCLIGV